MAHVQKRARAGGRPVYIVKWRTPDGKHRTKGGFATKKAAEAYATKQDDAKLRGAEYDPKAAGATFRQTAQDWLASRHDLKDTTRAAYADALAPNDGSKRHERLVALRIDAVFGGYPLNAIKRADISDWVQRMVRAGKKPSTVRNAYFLVRMVLGQAVQDGKLPANPADYVKLPTDHNSGTGATVDDPAQFLTAAQVSALVDATPWPINTYVHLAAWAGLRAAELAGLQVGDLLLPEPSLRGGTHTAARPGYLRVDRTLVRIGGELSYITPKTKGSRRRVPLTRQTTELLREFVHQHQRDDPSARLFPAVQLFGRKPTGARTPDGVSAHQQASALADLSVAEAEARLVLDWSRPLRHMTFYKAVYRPALLRANRVHPDAKIDRGLRFHSLRHTYASLCVAAGIPPLEIARFMGHAKVTTTLGVYAHLFEDDHANAMAALGAMASARADGENVIPLHG
jgi:integrase